MRNKLLMVSLIAVLLFGALNVVPALAQGPFDKECPTCHGTEQVACTNCQGSGKITTTQTCQTCQGTGKVEPTITLKSMNGWGTLVGLDWVARVQGVFHNEESEGTYGVATSEVYTVTETYYHSSPRTYFPPHEDVTITIDTPEIGLLTDWTYTIYLSQVDKITCPDCHGTGAVSAISNCPECGGTGWVTCPTCGGSGYVTNPVAVGGAIAGVVAVVAVAIAAAVIVKRRKPKATKEKT